MNIRRDDQEDGIVKSRIAFLAAIIIAMVAMPVHAPAETLKLRIGTEGTYRPMSFYDSAGKLTGFEVELVQAICAELKAECEFVITDIDSMAASLDEGRIDAMASGVRITPKRKKVVDFSDKYYTPSARFVTCRHKDLKEVSPQDVKGFKIGTQSNTSNSDYLSTNYADAASLQFYKTMDEAYLDLTNGRLDAVMSNAFVGYDFLQSERGKDCAYIGAPVTDPAYFGDGVGMAIKKGNADLAKTLNEGIKAVQADGTYDKLNAKYWPFSVK